ncbi:hypothetical protein KIN20_019451 [Parelaphostrongylus tenuis]|uniref:Uncharacterized protein n=1 Tax=Parelaphostrongylus tenuis TaxID=148309 RepID=A0AAD5MLC8_PARTN|nr:hypothetical protein KIN20_019451 [Parelaphostrongylus tenuis]
MAHPNLNMEAHESVHDSDADDDIPQYCADDWNAKNRSVWQIDVTDAESISYDNLKRSEGVRN